MKTVYETEKKLKLALSKLKDLNLENPSLKNNLVNLYNQKNQLEIEKKEIESKFQTLMREYTDNWSDYLWQMANFDELGRFISNHNKILKKFEDAKLMYCQLNQPDKTFNFLGNQERVVSLDGSKITIWVRTIIESDGRSYVYPATPREWYNGGMGIINSYQQYNNIFPDGFNNWFCECNDLGLDVKINTLKHHQDDGKEDEYINLKGIDVFCDNYIDYIQKTKKNVKVFVKAQKGESLSEFASRYCKEQGW